MSNLPSQNFASQRPNLSTNEEADLLARFRNALESTEVTGLYSISDRNAPDEATRRKLEDRRTELTLTMGKSDPRAVVQRISRLFMRFPSARIEDAEAVMAAYATDLSVYPMWAIEDACKEVIGGMLDSRRAFVPSSVELRGLCERQLSPFRCELASINQVLNAEIYSEPTPEVRARVAAEFRKLVEELSLNVDPLDKAARTGKRVLTRDEAQAALDRAIANPQPAPKFSPTLRAHLGIKDEEDAA